MTRGDQDRPGHRAWRPPAVGVVLIALLGVLTGLVAAAAVVVSVVWPPARARVTGGVVAWESARLGQAHSAAPGVRTVGFLAGRAAAGPVGGVLVLCGAVVGVAYLVWPVALYLQGRIGAGVLAVSLGVGAAALVLAWQLSVVLVAFDRWLARRLLGPDPQLALQARVRELAVSRAAVVDVVDGERRRIERDLHDGVQQRLVALGMLLGRARRAGDQPHGRDLLAQAHEETARVLADLREVVWRVYPAALDQDGLLVAVQTLAERSQVPVRVCADLSAQPPAAAGRAAYFVVCEALTNISRHADASGAEVYLHGRDGELVVRVVDDGHGGADARGGGLSGLARRVSALDGTLTVRSPAGGPTEITAVLPCG